LNSTGRRSTLIFTPTLTLNDVTFGHIKSFFICVLKDDYATESDKQDGREAREALALLLIQSGKTAEAHHHLQQLGFNPCSTPVPP